MSTGIVSIVLCIYLLIGMLLGFLAVKGFEYLAEKYEKGEKLDSKQLDQLTEASRFYSILGKQKAVMLIILMMAVMWPVAIYNGIKNRNS